SGAGQVAAEVVGLPHGDFADRSYVAVSLGGFHAGIVGGVEVDLIFVDGFAGGGVDVGLGAVEPHRPVLRVKVGDSFVGEGMALGVLEVVRRDIDLVVPPGPILQDGVALGGIGRSGLGPSATLL